MQWTEYMLPFHVRKYLTGIFAIYANILNNAMRENQFDLDCPLL